MSIMVDLKTHVRSQIEAHADEIIGFSQEVMKRPEPGFREHETVALMTEWLDRLGLPYRSGFARTGVKATLHGGGDGPTVGVLGELDAVVVPDHPLADPRTGAAHACGHHAQLAAMIGAGIGLRTVMRELSGNVTLFAVPAEEFVEVDQRLAMRERGEIEFPVGKAELLRLGAFEDIDLAMLVHTAGGDAPRFSVGDTMNAGAIVRATFGGRAAHAGGRPWQGRNAFKAATLAVQAIDAQRDTFPDSDAIRVNPVLTAVDAVPGVVPASARLEVMVRARTLDALRETCAKVERALRAGALAINVRLDLETLLAYLPLTSTRALDNLVDANAQAVLGPAAMARGRHLGSCTDMGDLSHVIPVTHPFASGATGDAHSPAYQVIDHHQAAVEPAIYLAMTVIDLLGNSAAVARQIVSESKPRLSLRKYVALRRSLDARSSWAASDGAD